MTQEEQGDGAENGGEQSGWEPERGRGESWNSQADPWNNGQDPWWRPKSESSQRDTPAWPSWRSSSYNSHFGSDEASWRSSRRSSWSSWGNSWEQNADVKAADDDEGSAKTTESGFGGKRNTRPPPILKSKERTSYKRWKQHMEDWCYTTDIPKSRWAAEVAQRLEVEEAEAILELLDRSILHSEEGCKYLMDQFDAEFLHEKKDELWIDNRNGRN